MYMSPWDWLILSWLIVLTVLLVLTVGLFILHLRSLDEMRTDLMKLRALLNGVTATVDPAIIRKRLGDADESAFNLYLDL